MDRLEIGSDFELNFKHITKFKLGGLDSFYVKTFTLHEYKKNDFEFE